MIRVHQNYWSGNLSLAASINDTTLTSPDFSSLPDNFSPGGRFMPMTLHTPTTKAYEIVHIVGHAEGSQTVTVRRGQEGSQVQPWDVGTLLVDAYTNRDVLPAGQPASNVHWGARWTDPNGIVKEHTVRGPRASVGLALSEHMGIPFNGGSTRLGAGHVLDLRAERLTSVTTNAQGRITCVWSEPFATATFTAWMIIIASGWYAQWTLQGCTATGATFTCYDGRTAPPTTAANMSLSAMVVGIGY